MLQSQSYGDVIILKFFLTDRSATNFTNAEMDIPLFGFFLNKSEFYLAKTSFLNSSSSATANSLKQSQIIKYLVF